MPERNFCKWWRALLTKREKLLSVTVHSKLSVQQKLHQHHRIRFRLWANNKCLTCEWWIHRSAHLGKNRSGWFTAFGSSGVNVAARGPMPPQMIRAVIQTDVKMFPVFGFISTNEQTTSCKESKTELHVMKSIYFIWSDWILFISDEAQLVSHQ